MVFINLINIEHIGSIIVVNESSSIRLDQVCSWSLCQVTLGKLLNISKFIKAGCFRHIIATTLSLSELAKMMHEKCLDYCLAHSKYIVIFSEPLFARLQARFQRCCDDSGRQKSFLGTKVLQNPQSELPPVYFKIKFH